MPLQLGSGRMDDAVLRNAMLNAMFHHDNMRRETLDPGGSASDS